MATTLLIETCYPFPSLTLSLPSDTPLSEISSHLPAHLPLRELVLSLAAGVLTLDGSPLSSLWDDDVDDDVNEVEEDVMEALSSRLVRMRLTPRLLGGKGGFGSQLRAAGGRMSSQKTSNNDSCRDLNGRRLSTIKEAKTLAAYLESEPERQKAKQEAQRAKLEKLERKLGIDGKGQSATDGGEPSASSSKRRFDDTEYLEQSRDIVDNVKSAVTAGMLKKRKKAKQSSPPQVEGAAVSSMVASVASESASKAGENAPSNEGSSDEAKEDGCASGIVEKILQSPSTAPVAAVASTSLAAVGA